MNLLIYIVIFCTFIYVTTIIYVIFGWVAALKTKQQKIPNTLKKISVVIAYRNEEINCINCLKSFEKQTLNKACFELILVNDHSVDKSKIRLENYAKTSQLSILMLDLVEQTSKKEALVLGIKNAKNPIIACTDADCEVPSHWLENIAYSFEEDTSMLLGAVNFNTNCSAVGIFQTLDMLAIQGITFGMTQQKYPILNNGANLAFLKTDFNIVGGYDNYQTPSGDDVFLLEKFKQANLSIKGLLAKNHSVITQIQPTWKLFFQQRLRWASKSKYYTNKNLIYLSSIIYVSNLMQIFIYLGIGLVDNFITVGIILLLSKWFVDFILLYLAAHFFNRKKWLIYVVVMQLIYPFYIVFIGLLSTLISFNWKDRIYK